MKNEKQQIEKLKEFWNNRNPAHENNTNTGEDMFWGTVLCIFDDMNRANGVNSESSNCNIPRVMRSIYSEMQHDNRFVKKSVCFNDDFRKGYEEAIRNFKVIVKEETELEL